MATTLTTTQLAQELDTDPKTLRRFFRSADSPIDRVGQGNRYMIERKQVARLRKQFQAWSTSHTRNVVKAA